MKQARWESPLSATKQYNDLCGVQYTTEMISAACTHCGDYLSAHCQDDLSGVQHTAEIVSAVCCTPLRSSPWCMCNIPRRWSQRCATHRRDDLSSVEHTAETNCTPRSQNQNLHLSQVAFNGTIRRNPFRGENICHERKDKSIKCLFTKNTFWSQRCAAHWGDNFVIENLGKI